MANAIVVPILTPIGSVHFTSVSHDATIEDVLSSLAAEPCSDILGDLHDHGWDLQMVRKEKHGRQWDESELESLGDDLVSLDTKVASLLEISPVALSSDRHFSAFPLTSHIHEPKLRLVSRHSLLSIQFTFLRVPEIHDGFRWRYFLARTTTVLDALKDIIEQLGLTKSIPLSGDIVDYEIEEVWIEGDRRETSRLSGDAVLSQVLQDAKRPSSSLAQRHFYLVVPDEWYRRPKPGSSTAESSIVNDGEDNTAKQVKRQLSSESTVGNYATATQKWNSTWTGTFSSSRLSSIFDSWLGPSDSSKAETSSETVRQIRRDNLSRRISVSGPISVNSDSESSTTSSLVNNEHGSSTPNANDISVEFEIMINELGLKGPQRKAMQKLPIDRKLYLLNQNRQMQSSLSTKSPASISISPGQIGSNSAGDSGLFERFSVASWTSGSQSSTTSNESYGQATSSMDDSNQRRSTFFPNESSEEPLSPIRAQNTGSLWNSWWASSSSSIDKVSAVEEKSPKWYIDGVRNFKTSDPILIKHLISMRVHLSTAKMHWIRTFLNDCRGIETLNTVLENINGKRGKGKRLTDSEETNLLEVIRCLRVLLNIEEGFKRVLSIPTLVTHIAYTLHSRSWKLRTLTSEVLAAICMLSLPQGHKLVLSAMSDYSIAFQEDFRFEELVSALRPSEDVDNFGDDGFKDEGDGTWEAKAAILALINALTNAPQALEDRILLREEFSRRGLNEVIVTLRYTRPPDSIVTQINVYTEEKFEDEEDMREHTHKLIVDKYLVNGEITELDQAMKFLSGICREDINLSNIMLDMMRVFSAILSREFDLSYKVNIVQVVTKFLEDVANSEEMNYNSKHNLGYSLTSPKLVMKLDELKYSLFSGISFPGELNEMQTTINRLIEERTGLRHEVATLSAEINALRPVSSGLSVHKDSEQSQESTSKQSFQGLVQRLVQKEKQVSQLQKELENLNLNKNVAENRDFDVRTKHTRDMDRAKLANFSDEIVSLKAKINELHQELQHKEKDIIYFKRALESVHSRSRLGFRMRDDLQSTSSEKLDADTLANQAINALALKDKEIEDLNLETAKLREKLKAAELRLLEKSFKNRVPPPPPPPPPPPAPALVSHMSRLSSNDVHSNRSQIASDSSSDSVRKNLTSSLSEKTSLSPISKISDGLLLEKQHEVQSGAAIVSSVSILSSAHPFNEPISLLSQSSLALPPLTIAKAETESPPPPPPPPLPPPPPPLVLKPQAKKLTKPPKSTKQLKPFFWNKLSAASLEKTVWNDKLESDILLNLKDIEEEFGIKNNLSQTSTQSTHSNKKAVVTTLLDITRANNVSIMLARIKYPPIVIRSAILELNDDKLSIDDLKAIARHLPTAEEQKRIREFVNIDQLANADQYFNIIMSISRLQNRLECMIFRRKLDLELDEIEPELEIMQGAANDLRSSDRFKNVLQIVLRVGNTLNESSFRGNARGFQLEALSKLKETKTVKGDKTCPTLLHYIARVLLRTDPTLLTFSEDILRVEAAARVSLQNLLSSVNALESGLSQIKAEVVYARNSHADSYDQFVRVMEPFILNASPRIHQTQDRVARLEKDLKQLLLYYGEPAESVDVMKPEDFFGLVTSFSSSLRQAASDILEAETKISKSPSKSEQNPLELHEKISKASLSAGADITILTPTSSEERSVNRGAVDEAIRSLRGGTRRTRPQRPISKIYLDGG